MQGIGMARATKPGTKLRSPKQRCAPPVRITAAGPFAKVPRRPEKSKRQIRSTRPGRGFCSISYATASGGREQSREKHVRALRRGENLIIATDVGSISSAYQAVPTP